MTIPGKDVPDPELDLEFAKTGVPPEPTLKPESRSTGGGPRVHSQADGYFRTVDQILTGQDRSNAERISGVMDPSYALAGQQMQQQPPMVKTRIVDGFAVPDINPDFTNAISQPIAPKPSPAAVQAEIDTLDAWTAVGVVQLGMSEQQARITARRLYSMSKEYPWISDVINSDFAKAAGMSEADAIAARFLPNFTMSEELFRVAGDMYAEARDQYDTVQTFETFKDKTQQGNWNITDVTPEQLVGNLAAPVTQLETAKTLEGVTVETSYDNELKAYGTQLAVANLNREAQGFLDEIRLEEVDNVKTTYRASEDELDAVVSYSDGQKVTMHVKLDPGTKITQENALRELWMASAGYAHEYSQDGELRGPQTLLGKGFELAGEPWRVYDRYNGPVNGIIGNLINAVRPDDDSYVVDWRSSSEIYAAQNADWIDTQVQKVQGDVDRNDLLLAATEQALIQNGPDKLVLAASANVDWVNSMGQAEFQQLRSEMVDEDQLRDILKQQVDDRSTLKRALDSGIQELASYGAVYDSFLQWFGTHGLAFGAFTKDVLTTGDVQEGWDKFQKAWGRANEANTVSEYWGWEGTSAAFLDFGASVFLDPFLYLTPGGKGLLQVAYDRLATRAGAREAMKLATTQRIAHMMADSLFGLDITDDVARQLVEATSRDAVKEIAADIPKKYIDKLALAGSVDEVRNVLYKGDLLSLSTLSYGMSAQEKLRLAAATTVDEVNEAIWQALPANGGTWLMRFDGHVAVRNTAMNISAASRLFSSLPKRAQNAYRRMFTTFRTERYVGLGPIDFMNDAESMIMGIWHDDPEVASKWLDDLWRTYRQFDQPYEYGRRAMLEEADALKQTLNTQLKSVPKDVRRFGRLRDQTSALEQRVRELDNRLSTAVGDEAKALARERRIITEGADALEELRRRRLKITNKPTVKRTEQDLANLEAIRAQEAEIRRIGVLKADSSSQWFKEMTAKYDEYSAAKEAVQRQLERAQRLSKAVLVPGNRDILVDYMDRLMEAIGDHAGLPVNPNKVTTIGARKVHVWDDVVGESTSWSGGLSRDQATELSNNLALFAASGSTEATSVIDKELLGRLEASGFGAKQGLYKLPASAMEIVAYVANKDAPWLARTTSAGIKRWSETAVGQKINESLSFLQRVWTSSVLLSPRTVIRSNLGDEPLRHMINFGVIGRNRGRAVGLGGEFGDELVRADIQGPLTSAIDELLPGRLKKLIGSNPELANDLAAGFEREMRLPGGFTRGNTSAYRVVNPGEKGFVDAARFWINGFLKNDPMVSSVWKAIALDDPNVFYKWWENMGYQLQRQPYFKTATGTVERITPQTAYEAGQTALDRLVEHWPAELQPEARRALLRGAETGADLPPSLLRKINKPMEGAVAEDVKGLMPKAFDNFYNAPGARRGSLITQAQMAQNIEILWDAAEANGKLLTSKRLSELAGVSQAEAARWLSTASWEIEYLVNKEGFILPRQIMEQAYRHARDYANNLMYQTGAGSIFGKKFQKFYPFGRAQMDYNTFFAQKMTDTLEFGLNPTVARTIKTIEHPIRTVQALVTPGQRVADQVPLGGLGRTFQPSILGHPIPFNARVVGRFAALFGAGSTQVKQQQEADPQSNRTEPQGPLALIDQATFLPIFPNETFLIDIGPGLGPLWSGLIHFLPSAAGEGDSVWDKAAAGFRDIAEALHPALEFDSREYDISNPGDWAKVGLEYFAPKSGSSLRGMANDAVLAMASAFNLNYQTLETFLDATSRPAGWRRTYKDELGTAITQSIADGNFPILGHPDADELLANVLNQTLKLTSRESLQTAANKNWLFWGDINEFDNQYSNQYNSIIDELDLLHQTGIVGDSEAAQLRDLQAATKLPGATTEDYLAFADAAAEVLFKSADVSPNAQAYLIAKHPGLAVNLVSGSQCVLSNGRPTGPSEYCDADGRLNLPPGPTGRDILDRGRNEGWIENRSEADIFDDVLAKLGSAFRRTSSWLWTNVTGDANWRGSSTGASFPKFLKETTYQISDEDRQVGELLGIHLDPVMTGAEVADAIDMRRDTWSSNVKPFDGVQTPAISDLEQNALNRQDDFGAETVQLLQNVQKTLEEKDIDFSEAPLDAQEAVRDKLRIAINRGLMSQEAYNRDLASQYGDLDYKIPDPPPASGLDWSMEVPRSDIMVIDGDTVRVQLADEQVRVRLLGVNAADYSSTVPSINDAALEQRDNLAKILDGAGSIQFGIWKADQFGTIRDEGGGQVRYLLWLYVDGKPVFNPDSFNFRNPTGVSSTGEGVPVSQEVPVGTAV